MHSRRRLIAEGLYERSRAHDAQCTDRLERFRNLEPQSAELLGVLIRACAARRILELGTSNGYSTVWLADAAQANGGSLVSVEIDPARVELARGALREAELEQVVDLRCQDAADALHESAEGEWDFVLLDAERPAYPTYLTDLLRVLAPGGLLVVDNVLSHKGELAEFTSLIESQDGLTQTVLPIGAGLRLAVRERLALAAHHRGVPGERGRRHEGEHRQPGQGVCE